MSAARRPAAVVVLLAALLTGSVPAWAGLAIGDPAPAFSVLGSDGERHALADYPGHVVVLEWSSGVCPFAEAQYESGNIPALQQAFKAQGVVWFTVYSSAPGKVGYVSAAQAHALARSRKAAPTATLLDAEGALGHLYGAKTTPEVVVIGADHRIAYHGAIDAADSIDADEIRHASPYLRNALTEIIAGRAASKPLTPPHGCAIKYRD